MLFKQLENGLYEGIAEEKDSQFEEAIFKSLAEGLSKNSPGLLRQLAAQGFTFLPSEQSSKLKGVLGEVLGGQGVVHSDQAQDLEATKADG